MSIHSELGHLAMPTNFLAYEKNRSWPKRVSNPDFSPPTLCRCATLAWLVWRKVIGRICIVRLQVGVSEKEALASKSRRQCHSQY